MSDSALFISGSLFTTDYLVEAIRSDPAYSAIDLADLRQKIEGIAAAFPQSHKTNESQTEDDFIWPVLGALGWTESLRQQNLTVSGRDDVPDGLLFADTEAKAAANAHGDQWKRYAHGLAVVESKRWARPLDRASGRDEATAPSTQMLRYLRRIDDLTSGQLRWGILTNGTKWRLYWAGARSVSEEFLEIDLGRVLALDGGDDLFADDARGALAAIDELGDIADVTLLAKEVDELRDCKLTASTKLQQANSTLGNATTAEALSRQGYADRIASVPETLRDANVLQAAIGTAKADLDRRKKAISDALEQQQIAQAALIKAEATLQNASTSLNDCVDAVKRKQAAFEARLIELGISETAYRAAIPDIDLIGELEGSIVEFDKNLAAARGRQTAATNAVGSAQRPTMEPFRLSCNQAQAAADDASRHSAEAQQKHRSLLDLQTSLADELKNLQSLEQSSGALRGLAEAFDGQNELRTSLETFAIGAMFDQVLEAANLRLDPMTSGRYRFERDTVSVGGRSKRGLDVRVHDIETGRAREIITLSGGETFIAALSLALGLSDIVEMTNGAIRLDTIFIDEGFGSLDTENDAGTLDQVLQVLQNIVGERRAVGLISHVPLVQQAVPNGFTVHKGVNGSQIEVRVG